MYPSTTKVLQDRKPASSNACNNRDYIILKISLSHRFILIAYTALGDEPKTMVFMCDNPCVTTHDNPLTD